MTVAGLQADNALSPEHGTETIDELCQFFIPLVVRIERGLSLGARLGMDDLDADEIETEPRIEWVGKSIETIAMESHDHPEITRWLACLDADTAHGAIRAHSQAFENSSTFATPTKLLGYIRHQLGKNALNDIVAGHRLGATMLGHAGGQRTSGRDASVFFTEDTGQLDRKGRCKSCREQD
jgi:hypothetical protein